MTDRMKGLYRKYDVTKADTGDALDGPCFVLRPDRDPAAYAALVAYMAATNNIKLKADLLGWLADLWSGWFGGGRDARSAETQVQTLGQALRRVLFVERHDSWPAYWTSRPGKTDDETKEDT